MAYPMGESKQGRGVAPGAGRLGHNRLGRGAGDGKCERPVGRVPAGPLPRPSNPSRLRAVTRRNQLWDIQT